MAGHLHGRTQRQIAAPPEKVFAAIVDFHEWPHWSPWEDLDPDLERTYTGAASGVGAVYEWEGNRKAGEGRMEITEAPADQRRHRPAVPQAVQGQQHDEFTLEPAGEAPR